MKISVILPTFNESGNIVSLVESIEKYVKQEEDYEIIVIDDSSPDGTYELVRQTFKNSPKVKTILRTKNPGLAASIKDGVLAATGTHIVIMDTDFTHSPDEIPNLAWIAQKYDIVSGSRFCAGGGMDSVRHYIASLLYNWFMRVLLRTQVQDNLGGYFIIKREKLLQLPIDKIFVGYGDYFFRMLYFAQRAKYTVVEIPTIYKKRMYGSSKSNFLKMLFRYTHAAIEVRRDRYSLK